MDNLDFLNLNTRRSYPIKEGVSRTSTDGVFVIPDEFMVDLMLCTSADVTTRFYVSEITNIPEQITIKVSDSLGVVAGT